MVNNWNFFYTEMARKSFYQLPFSLYLNIPVKHILKNPFWFCRVMQIYDALIIWHYRFVRLCQIHLIILLTVGDWVHTQYSFQLASSSGCLHGHEFQSLNVNGVGDCFLACIEDCLCLSFQIHHNTVCQLLSTSRAITPLALVEYPGCLYYDIYQEVRTLLNTPPFFGHFTHANLLMSHMPNKPIFKQLHISHYKY